MYTASFIVYIKTDNINKHIAEDIETRFYTSKYKLDRSMSKEKNKKVIGLIKDELGEKIVIKPVGLRAKTYSYLIDDGSEDKKAKDTKKCVIKRKLTFENCKSCLEGTQLENKINYSEKNEISIVNFFYYKRKQKAFIRNNKLILKTQQIFKSERHNDKLKRLL